MGRIERLRSSGSSSTAGAGGGLALSGRKGRMSVGGAAGAPGRRRPVGLVVAMAVGMVAVGAVAAGCGAPKQISLTSKDNNATIEASKGDTIVLKLDENPSTGYHWVMQFSGGLKVAGSDYKQRSGTQNLVGAGGTHTWTVHVTASGKQAIIGIYQAPGQPGAPESIGSHTFNVVVQVS